MSAILRDFSNQDDVYCPSFGRSVILQMIPGQPYGEILQKLRASKQFQDVFVSWTASQTAAIPSGPYFLLGNGLHQAWRLYTDDLDAFIVSVVPDRVAAPSE